jgi:hypothetical protein
VGSEEVDVARRTLTVILLCLTLVGASMAMAPAANAAVGPPNIPCEVLFVPPYDYPCNTAEATVVFVWDQAGNVWPFVESVGDEVDETVDETYHTVSCTVNPDDPDCP